MVAHKSPIVGVLARRRLDTSTFGRECVYNPWGLTEIYREIREKAKFLDGIRDLTATREAGFAKILAQDVVLTKKTNGIRDRNVYGSITVVRDAGSL